MLLFVLFAVFFSCTDDDLFYDTLDKNFNETPTGVAVGVTNNDSVRTNESDTTGLIQPDTTAVNEPDTTPVAIATATPSSGILPLDVTFKGTNASGDKEKMAYIWDFKDGETATVANPSHTFTKAGTYIVELTVTNSRGRTSTTTVSIAVNTEDNAVPEAKASATPPSGTVPLEVKFKGTNSSDDKGITAYKWDFKDGKTTTVANPLHTFTKAGSYDVELTVTDGEGLTATDTVSISVNTKDNAVPVAKASATPPSGTAPLKVSFSGTNSTDDKAITAYQWDFKDGGTSTEPNPSYTFKEAGTYNVKLTVTDAEGLTSNGKVLVTVLTEENTAPVSEATATPSSGTVPLEVKFKGTNSSDDKAITAYHWDFKDGTTSTAANPSHTFTKAGTYEVALKVTDAEGLASTDMVSITVKAEDNAAPVAKVSATPLTGTVPLAVSFKGTNSTDDKTVTAYTWDFKDGTTATLANPSHTFTKAGTYKVGLTVADAEGLKSTETITIRVNENNNEVPVAKASATPQSGTVPLAVSFKGSTSTDDKAISSYAWNFMDGSTASTANASHTFTKAGTYEVALKVTDSEGLNDTETVTITVNEKNTAPVANVSATPKSGTVPLAVSFKGSTSTDDKTITSYAWNFKDGATASTADPSHTFTKAGTYLVALKVTDSEGLNDTETVSITVSEKANAAPVAKVSATPQSGTVPLAVSFKGNTSTDDQAITSYIWNFKDGSTATTANASHTFTKAGTYLVTLKVIDSEGLNDTETVSITVNEKANAAPVAKAGATPITGTAPLKVNFTGSTSTDDNSITGYAWNFKDGASSTAANPSHTFNTPGTYAVELTVADDKGLTDKDVVSITVKAPVNKAPVAVATASPLSGNATLNVNFQGAGSSDDKAVKTYSWDFGNGKTSTAPNASSTYNSPGVYSAKLTVTDAEGLSNTDTVTITVTQPSGGSSGCTTNGGLAGDTGFKSWCWGDVSLPVYSGSKGVSFSNSQLVIDSECYEKQITKVGDQLKFNVNPTNPSVGGWCSRDFNMRAEIRTAPWNIRHPKGTEEWFGWSYTFGSDYVIDQNNEWLFFQVHPGIEGESPHTEIMVSSQDQYSGHNAGEIYVVNKGNYPDNQPTGITPHAGDVLNIVVHAIWDTSSNGLLQVWINGQNVYNKHVATIYSNYPWAGNAKWGIYKWTWTSASAVQQSKNQGITHLETYMGPLRMITRKPGDPDYGKDSYSQVVPR